MVAYVNMHYDNPANPHAHIMLTMRKIHQCSLKIIRPDCYLNFEVDKNVWESQAVEGDVLLIYALKRKCWMLCKRGENETLSEDVSDDSELGVKLRSFEEDCFSDTDIYNVRKILSVHFSLPLCSFSLKQRYNKQQSGWDSKCFMRCIRENLSSVINRHLSLAGVDEQVSHLSHEKLGIDQLPGVHVGLAGLAIAGRGLKSFKAEARDAVVAANALGEISVLREGSKQVFCKSLLVYLTQVYHFIKAGVHQAVNWLPRFVGSVADFSEFGGECERLEAGLIDKVSLSMTV